MPFRKGSSPAFRTRPATCSPAPRYRHHAQTSNERKQQSRLRAHHFRLVRDHVRSVDEILIVGSSFELYRSSREDLNHEVSQRTTTTNILLDDLENIAKLLDGDNASSVTTENKVRNKIRIRTLQWKEGISRPTLTLLFLSLCRTIHPIFVSCPTWNTRTMILYRECGVYLLRGWLRERKEVHVRQDHNDILRSLHPSSIVE